MALTEETKKIQAQNKAQFETDPLYQEAVNYAESLKKSGIDIDNIRSPYEGVKATEDVSKYRDLLPTGGVDPYATDVREEAAQNQSGIGLIGNALGQAVTEVGLGTLESIGYLADFQELGNIAQGKEAEFDNWFSKIVRGAKEQVQEDWFPVYQTKEAQEDFAPWDGTWWASNAKSIATSLSMLLPATGVARGAAALGKLAKFSPEVVNLMRGVSAAVASRRMENTMEANQQFQSALQRYRSKGLDEDSARAKAGEEASKVWKANSAMFAVDLLQYSSLFKSFGNLSNLGKFGRVAELGKQMGSEAIEEGFQFVSGEEAKYSVENAASMFGGNFSDRLGEYVRNNEMQTSMFFGALGGGVFDAAAPLAKKIAGAKIDIDNKLARFANFKDVESFNKLQDTKLADLIYQHAKRGSLDTLANDFSSIADMDEAQLDDMGINKDELADKVQSFNSDINFAQEELAQLNNNTMFKDAPDAKMDYLLTKLESRFNKRSIKNIKGSLQSIYDELGNNEELSKELIPLKRIKSDLDALKNAKKVISKDKKIDKVYKRKVLNSIDNRIESANNRFKEMSESYKETTDKNVDFDSALVTSRDDIIQDKTNKLHEVMAKDQFVVAPKLLSFKKAEEVSKAQEDIEKSNEKSQNSAVVNQVENAKTPESINQVDSSVPEDKKQVVTTTVNDKADEQAAVASDNPKERYGNSPHLFVKEHKELNSNIAKELENRYGENIPEVLANTIFDLQEAKNPEELNEIIDYINANNTSPFIALGEVIRDFFNNKEEQKNANTINKNTTLDSAEEIVEFKKEGTATSDTGYTNPRESYTPTSYEPFGAKFTQYAMTQNKKGDWVINYDKNTREPIDNPVKIDIDWEYLNNPNTLLPSTEVEYVVDLDRTINKSSRDKYHAGRKGEDFINESQVLIGTRDNSGNLRIVQALPIYKEDSTHPISNAKLKELRNAIWAEVKASGKKSGQLVTSLKSKVTKKHAGRLITSKGTNSPHEVLKDSEPLVFGVVVRKGDLITLEVGDASNNHNIEMNLSDDQLGAVYMLVRGANGKIIPARCFTEKLENLPELREKAKKLLEDSNKDNWTSKRKELRDIVYLDYNYIEATDSFEVRTKGENKVFTEMVSKDNLDNFLMDKIAQINSTKINSIEEFTDVNYNEQISKEGRLKVDLMPKKYVANARFDIDLDFGNQIQEGEVPKAKATETTVIKDPSPIKKVKVVKSTLQDDVANNQEPKKTVATITADNLGNTIESYYKDPENSKKFKSDMKELSAFMNSRAKTPEQKTQTEAISSQFALNEFQPGHLAIYMRQWAQTANTALGASIKPYLELVLDFYKGKMPKVTTQKPKKIGSKLGTIKINKANTKLRKAEESDYTRWDQDKELAWFKKRFPEVPITVVAGLINVYENGGIQAWGMFKNAAVYLSENAKVGTTYHEAFHAVFNLFLNNNQRVSILNEASIEAKTTDPLLIEEYLAEKFREYVDTQEASSPTLTSKVKNFFKRLYQVIKNKLTNRISVNELFFRAEQGMISKVDFKRNVESLQSTTRYLIPGMTPYEQTRRVVAVSDVFSQVVDAIIESSEDYRNMPRKKVITSVGVDNIMSAVYDSILESSETASEEDQLKYFKVLSNLLEVNEEGEIAQYRKLGELVFRRLAQTEGIKVRLDKTVDTSNDSPNDEKLHEINEDEVRLEGWQIASEQQSGKDSLSKEIRKELSYIPLVKEDGGIIGDDLGFMVYADFNTLYAYLKRELSDTYRADDMLDKLKKIVSTKPHLQRLVNKLEGDHSLMTKFFVDFAKSHADFKIIIERRDKKGEKPRFIVTSANRQSVKNILLDEWKDSSHNSVTSEILDKNGNFINSATSKLEKDYKSASKIVKGKVSPSASSLSTLSEVITRTGMDVTESDLERISTDEKQKKQFFDSLDIVMARFYNSKNPFDEGTAQAGELDTIARSVASNRLDMFESSFKNSENKTIYSHIIPNFISKQLERFRGPRYSQTVKYYTDTKFYKNSPWLMLLGMENQQELRDNLEYSIIDGVKYHGKDKGIKYTAMSPKDYDAATLNMFFNNGSEKFAWYRMPVLSDAPNSVFIKFKKFNNSQVLNAMYMVYQQEWARINDIKLRRKAGKAIKNYDTEASEKFILLPFLNEAMGDPAKREAITTGNKEEIKSMTKDWLEKELNTEISRLNKSGLFSEELLDSRIEGAEAKRDFMRNYFYNTVLANTQMTTLFSGDPAFYKPDSKESSSRTVDFQKRNKQVWSPGLLMDVSASFDLTEEQASIEGNPSVHVRTTYNTIYLKDVEIPSPNLDSIDQALGDTVDKATKASILDAYSNINQADAQAYITLPRYREIMIGLGRWTSELQDAYPRLLNGTASGNDLKLVMQPLKPFQFTHTKVDNVIVPVQNKNSEYLLLPQFIKNADGSYISKDLGKLYDYMTKEGQYKDRKGPIVDTANFESAVKAGLYGQVSIDNIDKASVHKLSNSDFKLQQETPEHHIDAEGLFGTQIRKLIISDISNDATFEVEGNTFTKKQLIDLYQDIIVEDLKEAYKNTKKRLATIEDIQELLLDEIRDRSMGEEMEEAVKIVVDPITGNKRFNLPLYHPLQAKRVESLLNSVYKNKVTKQKIKGGPMVQVSNFGFTEELNLVINNGRLEYAECMLPWWSRKYFEPLLDENGQLDISKVQDKRILDMIGYRIPTEDKYSMMPLRVKGFLLASAGGAVMLPMEITAIAGSDFDVDKMYIMMPEFEISEDGEDIRKVEFDYSTTPSEQSKAARNNAKIDLMWSILTNPDTFAKFINPGSFDTLKALAKKVNKLEGLGEESLDLVLPSTQTELFKRNMTGKQLVGIFANHNAHHAVLQHLDVGTTRAISFDGELRQSLSDVMDVTGNRYISKNLAEFLAAVVDNAKEPVSSFININTYTADVVSLIVRMGFPLKTAVSFMSQPILKKFSDIYFANGATVDAANIAIGEIKSLFDAADIKSPKNLDISTKELWEGVSGDLITEGQMKVFTKFLAMKEQADALADLVRAMRADTTGAGPTLSHNEKALNSIESVIDNKALTGHAEAIYGEAIGPLYDGSLSPKNQPKILEALDKYFPKESNMIVRNPDTSVYEEVKLGDYAIGKDFKGFNVYGIDSVIPMKDVLSVNGRSIVDIVSGTHGYKMSNAFTDYGIKLPTADMSRFFPWLNREFRDTKDLISNNTKSGSLSVQQLEHINYEFVGYLASDFGFFSPNNRQTVIMELPNKLRKLKDTNRELVENNDLLKRLIVRDSDGDVPIDRIEFKNTGSVTNEERVSISEGWKDLLINPEFSTFAEDLVRYTYFTSGFRLTPNSFGHLVPVEFYSNLEYDGVTFNQHLENKINSSKYLGANMYFMNQFYMNNYDNSLFVPNIDRENNNISSDIKVINGIPAYFTVNAMDEGTSRDFIISTSETGASFVPYVKKNIKGKTYLFRANPTTDPMIAEYIVVNKLGIPNYVTEYGTYDSIVEGNNISPKVYEGLAGTGLVESNKTREIKDSEVEDTINKCNNG